MNLKISFILIFTCFSFFDADGTHEVLRSMSKFPEYFYIDSLELNYNNKQLKLIKNANRYYERLAYNKAIQLFTKVKDLHPSEALKLANAYRLINDTQNAERWYSEVVDKINDPKIYFYYAQVLQSNGNDTRAAIYFDRYSQSIMGNSEWNKESKTRASKILNTNRFHAANIELKNEINVNTEGIEYSPSFFRDNIIFVSTRSSQGFNRSSKDPWIDENFMSLFKAPIQENNVLGLPQEFSYDLKSEYHEGPVSFSNNGEIIYFTRNNFHRGERINDSNGIMKLEIFSARWNGEHWVDTKALNFNIIDADECHPSVSTDGAKLYFSSNRPGGYGGMDLYVSENRYGLWTNPKNLGPTINTPGNEVFPFIHSSGELFFASNGWDGLGGLDIFFSRKIDNQHWGEAINIGKPFNSEKDDFGFIMTDKGNLGYISSNRKGGVGKDDIYSFELDYAMNSEINPLISLTNEVYQHQSFKSLTPIASIPISQITYQPAFPEINIPENKKIILSSPEEIEIFRALEDGTSFVLEHVYYEFNDHKILEQAAADLDHLVKVMQAYPDLIVELGSHTDARGTPAYNKLLSQRRAKAAVEYIVKAGIDKDRILAHGYGEEKIRNRCWDGIQCTDAEHQYNRRTEVKVVQNSSINK